MTWDKDLGVTVGSDVLKPYEESRGGEQFYDCNAYDKVAALCCTLKP